MFGQYGARTDEEAAQRTDKQTAQPGPTLVIDYSTMGGELVLRDFPDNVEPRSFPDWPGYPVYPEERPDTTGLSSAEAARLYEEWVQRHEEQTADQARIDGLMAGPCAKTPEAEKPVAKQKTKKQKRNR